MSKNTIFFNIFGKISFLNWTLGLRKSFLNQTTYLLRFWLLQQSYLNRDSFLNRSFLNRDILVYSYVYINFSFDSITLTETFPIDYGPWGERVTSLSKALFRRIFNLFLSPISTRWVIYVPLFIIYMLCFDRFFFVIWWKNEMFHFNDEIYLRKIMQCNNRPPFLVT